MKHAIIRNNLTTNAARAEKHEERNAERCGRPREESPTK
jgi:hypothetical protein